MINRELFLDQMECFTKEYQSTVSKIKEARVFQEMYFKWFLTLDRMARRSDAEERRSEELYLRILAELDRDPEDNWAMCPMEIEGVCTVEECRQAFDELQSLRAITYYDHYWITDKLVREDDPPYAIAGTELLKQLRSKYGSG